MTEVRVVIPVSYHREWMDSAPEAGSWTLRSMTPR